MTQRRPGEAAESGFVEVQSVRQTTQTFRQLDNRLGGGHFRAPVVDFLNTRVMPLLRDGHYSHHVGRSLFAATAELTQLAGWLAYDVEKHGLAQRYLVQALALARFAGDHGLGGEILAAMSHQAAYLAQSAHAVDMARTAQVAAQRAGLPVLLTECHVMEAHGHAGRGDARSCARALHQAEKSFDRAAVGDQPTWLAYFDEAYLAAKFAHCFRDLGQAAHTERYARRSLDMDESYLRGKTFNVALLATAYVLQGELEEACARGREAVDLAAGLESARVLTYIRDLRTRLAPYADTPLVREFNEYAAERLPAPRAHARPR